MNLDQPQSAMVAAQKGAPVGHSGWFRPTPSKYDSAIEVKTPKITFGGRTDAGATRMAKLMTVAETSRRHRKRVRDIYYELCTRPPDRVITNLYAMR